MKVFSLFISVVALVFVSSYLTAQEPNSPAAKPLARTVELSVIITDVDNKSVARLHKEDLHLFEDKIEQSVSSIGVDSRPVDCVLLIDSSASMRSLLSVTLEAARLIIVSRRNEDRFSTIRFISSDKIQTVEDFTSDENLMVNALQTFYVEGGQSAVIDAVYVSAEHVAKHNANNSGRRKVIVVITDGEDRNSYYKSDQMLKLLRDKDVQVFAIGFTTQLEKQNPGFLTPGAKDKAEKLLRDVTETSGGRLFLPTDKKALIEALNQLINNMRSQFRLTYQSASAIRGFRKVEVTLTPAGGEKLIAVVPRGYYVEK